MLLLGWLPTESVDPNELRDIEIDPLAPFGVTGDSLRSSTSHQNAPSTLHVAGLLDVDTFGGRYVSTPRRLLRPLMDSKATSNRQMVRKRKPKGLSGGSAKMTDATCRACGGSLSGEAGAQGAGVELGVLTPV